MNTKFEPGSYKFVPETSPERLAEMKAWLDADPETQRLRELGRIGRERQLTEEEEAELDVAYRPFRLIRKLGIDFYDPPDGRIDVEDLERRVKEKEYELEWHCLDTLAEIEKIEMVEKTRPFTPEERAKIDALYKEYDEQFQRLEDWRAPIR